MIKKIAIITLMSVGILPLTACGKPKEEKTVATVEGGDNFTGEVSIVDGEIVTKPVNTSDPDTISAKKGSTIILSDILSAMYGDNIETTGIRCTNGVSEVNGDSVKVLSNTVLEFYLTVDGQTSHKELNIIATEE